MDGAERYGAVLLSRQNYTEFSNSTADMNSRKTPMLPLVKELLSYDDERFLQCAYYTILGRKPDKEGMCVYLKCLCAGISKTRIITILAKSPEGKSNGVSAIAL